MEQAGTVKCELTSCCLQILFIIRFITKQVFSSVRLYRFQLAGKKNLQYRQYGFPEKDEKSISVNLYVFNYIIIPGMLRRIAYEFKDIAFSLEFSARLNDGSAFHIDEIRCF